MRLSRCESNVQDRHYRTLYLHYVGDIASRTEPRWPEQLFDLLASPTYEEVAIDEIPDHHIAR